MKTLILTFVFSLLFSSCSENYNPSDQLPPETQIGANTFGCYVGNRLLIPRNGYGGFEDDVDGLSYLGGYPEVTDYYELDVIDYKSQRTANMLIHLQSVHQNGLGDYLVDKSNGMSNVDGYLHNYIHCKVFDNNTNSYKYYRSFDNSGIIKITRYDYPNGIISGTFSCKIRNSANPSDEIEITQGRFDINGYTLPNKVFP